ncbi:long-chain-fatty-acid--CoA ligase [Phytomonospora sp. NPDC050363]|uniref:long-chain-fatty-acid--CoA ligase n=1 Tax=Phytomonospora sp. NPDC050363 TaxID=3155642 RepID=UPI0033EA4438
MNLNIWALFGHAARHHREVEIVTGLPGGAVHRYTYGDFCDRAEMLMAALDGLELAEDAVVGTLAWNSHRHLEAYFAVPGTGRVLHTLNLRLSPAELARVIEHGGDEVILADADLLPLLVAAKAAGGLGRVRHVLVLGDTDTDAVDLPGLVSYEDLIAVHEPGYPRREWDEHRPLGICHTSGTTGDPKGAVYTHRSTVLHAFGVAAGSGLGLGPGDCGLAVVPMFHGNAWGMPYAATMVGAKQVFLAGPLTPARLAELMLTEEVTVSAGVPTVWLDFAEHLTATGLSLPDLRHVVCGGARPPRSLVDRYRREFGIPLVQAWGMTETSPLGSVAWPKHHMRHWDDERLLDEAGAQAGIASPGVEVSIRDGRGEEVPWDGRTMGALHVRGMWVVDGYLHGEAPGQFTDGWFATGDVAVGSPYGYIRIADRTKDLIKSGGEWISSVDMEAALMGHPDVAEAAVVAIPDPRWQERPLACVVPAPGREPRLESLREHLLGNGFARWQLPERMELLEAIPRTGVGKFDKKALRTSIDEKGTLR